MQYNIRPACISDLPAIYHFTCSLEEIIFDKIIFESIFISNINNKMLYYLVAEVDNEIAGFISCHTQNLLHHCGRVAEIQELFVDENYRKIGIGAQLITYLEKILREAGCVLAEVTAQHKRVQTHAFSLPS